MGLWYVLSHIIQEGEIKQTSISMKAPTLSQFSVTDTQTTAVVFAIIATNYLLKYQTNQNLKLLPKEEIKSMSIKEINPQILTTQKDETTI